MIGALACFLTGALLFVEQELDGIVIGRPNPLTGEPSVNFRNVDLDRDGLQDILLPGSLLLQRSGEFPPALSIPLPRISEDPDYDVFGGKLYLRTSGMLEMYRLEGMTWEREDAQRIKWPQPESQPSEETLEETLEENQEGPKGTLGRYLHDLSGDGVPEIVIPTLDGLQIFSKRGPGYQAAHTLDVYPPATGIFPEQRPIWPAEARAVSSPMSRLRFRLFLDGASIIVFSSSTDLDARVRHRVTRWLFDPDEGLRPDPRATAPLITQALPAFLQPCRLNEDDIPDFAGLRTETPETSLVPLRINEIVATTDGGKTLQTFRSKSFQSLCALVDVDGDGRRDAIVEWSGLFRGGLREFLLKSMSERTLSHTLHVHLQDERGHFSKLPNLRHKITIKLTRPPFRRGRIFDQYQNGELINITGDIDGDGRRDLVVRTHPDRLSIYLNQEKAFSRSADRTIAVAEHTRFGVADVDGDGRSDIIVYGDTTLDAEGPGHTVVYFSRTSSA